MGDTSLVDRALESLLNFANGVDEGASQQPVMMEHEAYPTSSSHLILSTSAAAESTVAAVRRAVAPMKEARPCPPPRQQAVDRIARRWMPSPVVSTDAAYNMLVDMAAYSPFAIAAAAKRRFNLSGRQQLSLRKRLSAAAHAERRMVAEIRELLPDEPLDGNSAIAMVSRVQGWLYRHSRRPQARVNE